MMLTTSQVLAEARLENHTESRICELVSRNFDGTNKLIDDLQRVFVRDFGLPHDWNFVADCCFVVGGCARVNSDLT